MLNMKNTEKNRRFSFLTRNIQFHGFKSIRIIIFAFAIAAIGCEKFYEPDLGVGLRDDVYFNDESEFRAAVLGLYSLQQDLVEQLVILGELRGDLMVITDNADNDLREIYYFNVSPNNKYASPRGFYRLIASCNSLLNKLEEKHPNVTDLTAPVNNYDRFYGEVLCMRAWAYFNAARIYGKIPYIPSSITDIKEIEKFVNSPKTVRDTMKIIFARDGLRNDTIIRDTTYVIDNAFLDIFSIIDTFTLQLNTRIKAVGVNHFTVNSDRTWDATIWTNNSRLVLLGQMYLTKGDLVQARASFRPILFFNDGGNTASIIRFGLDRTFQNNSWRNILTTINTNEHIYVLRFNKADRQRHELQYLFSNFLPNSYQIKPSRQAVNYWETIWAGFRRTTSDQTGQVILDPLFPGNPGDFYRGINVSYGYFKYGIQLSNALVDSMLHYKRLESYFDVNNIMDGVDTVITKYSLSKNPFDWDANFILYRAAGVHLYYTEVLTNQFTLSPGSSFPTVDLQQAQDILNNGNYRLLSGNRGVRGRVGFPGIDSRVNDLYLHDPYTNEVTGVRDLSSLIASQEYLEDMIMEERARELAYEGERFYDLMRVAQRRMKTNPDKGKRYLADRVAARYNGAESAMMHGLLMDENNWYIPFYLGTE